MAALPVHIDDDEWQVDVPDEATADESDSEKKGEVADDDQSESASADSLPAANGAAAANGTDDSNEGSMETGDSEVQSSKPEEAAKSVENDENGHVEESVDMEGDEETESTKNKEPASEGAAINLSLEEEPEAVEEDEIQLNPGEFLFELGCAYCLKRVMTMREMTVHHQQAHPGPYKIFYVLRWWDSALAYWMCPLCEHVETGETSSTVHHHAFLDHAKEEICEPEPGTPDEGVRSFVLSHWETTMKELLRGRNDRKRLKAGEARALDKVKEYLRAQGLMGMDDEDDFPPWRHDLLTKTKLRPVDSLPPRVWRTMCETGTHQLSCTYCNYKCDLNAEATMQRHLQNHMKQTLYMCEHCEYNKEDVQAVVNHVAFSHKEEMMEALFFQNKPGTSNIISTPTRGLGKRNASMMSKTDATFELSSGEESDDEVTLIDVKKAKVTPQPLKVAMPFTGKTTASTTITATGITNNPPPKKTSDLLAPRVPNPIPAQAEGDIEIKDSLIVCAYCWHKGTTCAGMSDHFGLSHKRQVRKVLYMVHNEKFEHSHWCCPLCAFVRDDDKKHMVQLHVFSKHGREDMLYPGLKFPESEIVTYLNQLWREKIAGCINSEGHVETDAREQAIQPRSVSGSILKAEDSANKNGVLGRTNMTTSMTPTYSNMNTGMRFLGGMPGQRKVSSYSDQIVVLEDPTPDSSVTCKDEPEVVEVGHLTDEMQDVLTKAYTHVEATKTCCNLCTYRKFEPEMPSNSMSTQNTTHILEHVMLHLGDEIWLCPYCFLHKSRKILMTGHVHTEHSEEKLQVMRYIPSYSRYIKMLKTLKNVYVWICSVCSRKDTRKNVMINHLRLGHPDEDFSMGKLKKGFLIKIDEAKMREILAKQALRPRIKMHRVEDYEHFKYIKNLWDELKLRIVQLPMKKGKGKIKNKVKTEKKDSPVKDDKDAKQDGDADADKDSISKDDTKEDSADKESEVKKTASPVPGKDSKDGEDGANKEEEDSDEEDEEEDKVKYHEVKLRDEPAPQYRKDGDVMITHVKPGSMMQPIKRFTPTMPINRAAPMSNMMGRTNNSVQPSGGTNHGAPKVINVLHPLFCMYCDKINTRNIVQIKRHLHAVHPTEIPIARDIVTKAKKKPQYLYTCPTEECYFITYSWSEMYDHLHNRHKGETFGFNLAKLPRNSRLPINARTAPVDHHEAISIKPGKSGKRKSDEYKCSHCEYTTLERAYACLHVQIQHPDDIQSVIGQDGKTLYFCPLKHCSFGTHYESLYKTHKCLDGPPPQPAPPKQNRTPYIKKEPAQTLGSFKPAPRTLGSVYTPNGMPTTKGPIPRVIAPVAYSASLLQPLASTYMLQPQPVVIAPQPIEIAPIDIRPIDIRPEPEAIVIKPDPDADQPPMPVPVMMVENMAAHMHHSQ